MIDSPRKKSPRAPSLALDEALDRAYKAYDKERLHATPTEIVAQNIGYKSANNGAALGALASLRYFGLLERPKEGVLAVSKDVESYKFAPDDDMKLSLRLTFLKRPTLYNELLEKYESGLPSDANLKFELIQRGFAPQAAEAVMMTFKRSVEYAGYFDSAIKLKETEDSGGFIPSNNFDSQSVVYSESQDASVSTKPMQEVISQQVFESTDFDRIPVRLPGGRRAWLMIPTPFYDIDKKRLKAQIDLLLTEEDESKNSLESD